MPRPSSFRNFGSVDNDELGCSGFQSQNLDLIALAVLFVIVGLILLCCAAKRKQRLAKYARAMQRSKVLVVAKRITDDQVETGKHGGNDNDNVVDATPVIVAARAPSVRRKRGGCCCCLIGTFSISLLLTWLLVGIGFFLLRTSLFFPAQTAAECTPCSGDLSTITFNVPDPPEDRSPYCCAYDPGSFVNVVHDGFVPTANGDNVNYWVIGASTNQSEVSEFDPNAPTVLFSHGSGRTLAAAFRLQRYAFFASLGLNVIAYDYAGYGKSTLGPNSKLGDEAVLHSFAAVYALATSQTNGA